MADLEMRAHEFAVWLRDEARVIRHSKEGDQLKLPSNGELRRWIANGAIECNGQILKLEGTVTWPIKGLILFPKNKKAKVTIV